MSSRTRERVDISNPLVHLCIQCEPCEPSMIGSAIMKLNWSMQCEGSWTCKKTPSRSDATLFLDVAFALPLVTNENDHGLSGDVSFRAFVDERQCQVERLDAQFIRLTFPLIRTQDNDDGIFVVPLKVKCEYIIPPIIQHKIGIVCTVSKSLSVILHSARVSQACAWIPRPISLLGDHNNQSHKTNHCPRELPVVLSFSFGTSLCTTVMTDTIMQSDTALTEASMPCGPRESLLSPPCRQLPLFSDGAWWWVIPVVAPTVTLMFLSSFVLVFGAHHTSHVTVPISVPSGIPINKMVDETEVSLQPSLTLSMHQLIDPKNTALLTEQELDFDLSTIIQAWRFFQARLPNLASQVIPSLLTWSLTSIPSCGPFMTMSLPSTQPCPHLSDTGLPLVIRPSWLGAIVCRTTDRLFDEHLQVQLVYERTHQLVVAFLASILTPCLPTVPWIVFGFVQHLSAAFQAQNSVFGFNHIQMRHVRWSAWLTQMSSGGLTRLSKSSSKTNTGDNRPNDNDEHMNDEYGTMSEEQLHNEHLERLRHLHIADPGRVAFHHNPMQECPLVVGSEFSSLSLRLCPWTPPICKNHTTADEQTTSASTATATSLSPPSSQLSGLEAWDSVSDIISCLRWKLKTVVVWHMLEQLVSTEVLWQCLNRWAHLPLLERHSASLISVLSEHHVASGTTWSVSEFMRVWVQSTMWPSLLLDYNHDPRSHETVVHISSLMQAPNRSDVNVQDASASASVSRKRKPLDQEDAAFSVVSLTSPAGRRKSSIACKSTANDTVILGVFPMRLRVHELTLSTEQVIPLARLSNGGESNNTRSSIDSDSLFSVELRFPSRGTVRRNRNRKVLDDRQKARIPIDELLNRHLDSTVKWLRPDRQNQWPAIPLVRASRVMFLHQLVGEEDVVGQLQALVGLSRLHAGLIPIDKDLHGIGMSVTNDLVIRALEETIMNEAVYFPVRIEALRALLHRWHGATDLEERAISRVLTWIETRITTLFAPRTVRIISKEQSPQPSQSPQAQPSQPSHPLQPVHPSQLQMITPPNNFESLPVAALDQYIDVSTLNENHERDVENVFDDNIVATTTSTLVHQEVLSSGEVNADVDVNADVNTEGNEDMDVETNELRKRIMDGILLGQMISVCGELRRDNIQPPRLEATQLERNMGTELALVFSDDRTVQLLSSLLARFVEHSDLQVTHTDVFLQVLNATGRLVPENEDEASYLWSLVLTVTRHALMIVSTIVCSDEDIAGLHTQWLAQSTARIGISIMATQQRIATVLGRKFVQMDPVYWLQLNCTTSLTSSSSSSQPSSTRFAMTIRENETALTIYRAQILLSVSPCDVGRHFRDPCVILHNLMTYHGDVPALIESVLAFWSWCLDLTVNQAISSPASFTSTDVHHVAVLHRFESGPCVIHPQVERSWRRVKCLITEQASYRMRLSSQL